LVADCQCYGQIQAAGGNTRKHIAVVGDIVDELQLARVAGIAEYGFVAHVGASLFHTHGEVQDTEMLRIELRGHFALATGYATRTRHRHRGRREVRSSLLTVNTGLPETLPSPCPSTPICTSPCTTAARLCVCELVQNDW